LLRLGVYFTDYGNSLNGWHIAAVTAQYAKELCPICHSRQVLADFTMNRISRCDGHDMPTVAPTIARIANTRQWIIIRVQGMELAAK
jgi:hypothetical protein